KVNARLRRLPVTGLREVAHQVDRSPGPRERTTRVCVRDPDLVDRDTWVACHERLEQHAVRTARRGAHIHERWRRLERAARRRAVEQTQLQVREGAER